MDVNIACYTDEISYRMTEFRTFYLYNSIFLPICYAGGIYQSRVCISITHIIKIIRKPLYISMFHLSGLLVSVVSGVVACQLNAKAPY